MLCALTDHGASGVSMDIRTLSFVEAFPASTRARQLTHKHKQRTSEQACLSCK